MASSPASQSPEATLLLKRVAAGDGAAEDALWELVHGDLRRIAESFLKDERAGHTLQATALVNEAYLRLIDQRQVNWEDRAHFLSVAARMLRRILVDHARRRSRLKRGGEAQAVTIQEAHLLQDRADVDLLGVHEALERLAGIHEEQARIVEMRAFGGLTLEEVAAVLGMSRRTVDRHWACARAWLFRALNPDQEP